MRVGEFFRGSLVLCKAFFARLVHGKLANKKPLAEWQGAFRLAAATASVAEEQHAGGFFFAGCFVSGDGAIEELVDFQVDFEEGRALGDLSGDQGFAQGILDVARSEERS